MADVVGIGVDVVGIGVDVVRIGVDVVGIGVAVVIELAVVFIRTHAAVSLKIGNIVCLICCEY